MTGDCSVIVYLGPSLDRSSARRLLPADYRPPVRRGDLPASHEGTIVIVDGEFGQSLSVSPNEILRLLDGGTRVIGAGSMGALRAAELQPFGMEGCGWVFDAYASGRIIADDEVAVMFSPHDLAALTVPLVNVRSWLETSDLDARAAQRLLRVARAIFYADRSPERLFAAWEAAVGAPELRRLLRASGGAITDIKASDAALGLARAASHLEATPIRGGTPPWRPSSAPRRPAAASPSSWDGP
jgi:hypothetical protein